MNVEFTSLDDLIIFIRNCQNAFILLKCVLEDFELCNSLFFATHMSWLYLKHIKFNKELLVIQFFIDLNGQQSGTSYRKRHSDLSSLNVNAVQRALSKNSKLLTHKNQIHTP